MIIEVEVIMILYTSNQMCVRDNDGKVHWITYQKECKEGDLVKVEYNCKKRKIKQESEV